MSLPVSFAVSLRTLLVSVATLALAASFVPALASAQAFNGNCGVNQTNWLNNFGFNGNNNNTNCTEGQLLVYVQVLGNTGYTYNNNSYNNGFTNPNTPAPSSFEVTVNGSNASPNTFAGSLSGTLVTLYGGYSVQAAQLSGYSATYSTGCNGTLANGSQATCVITENNTTPYSPYPTPYPYPYNYPTPLSCTPSYQTVNLNQTTTFDAVGGDYSQYNWSVNGRSYLNVGPTLNIPMEQTGTENVTVTNGTATATCTVNVVYSGAPAPVVINPLTLVPTNSIYPAGVTVTPTYIPSLPDTGFAPESGAALAFVAAFLIAATVAAFPYVRQAFAVVLG